MEVGSACSELVANQHYGGRYDGTHVYDPYSIQWHWLSKHRILLQPPIDIDI